LHKRRTHPSFLSNDEAARERRRTEEMVRGIVGFSHAINSVENKQVASIANWKGTTRLGETCRFIVDFSGEERLVIICGKEIPFGSPFKLGLTLSQAIGIRELLKKAIDVMRGSQKVKIGEKSGFVVDYDGKFVMLYEKEAQAECRFKLAFDKGEIIQMIYLLKKVYNFFY
jgi:hypothetical protein